MNITDMFVFRNPSWLVQRKKHHEIWIYLILFCLSLCLKKRAQHSTFTVSRYRLRRADIFSKFDILFAVAKQWSVTVDLMIKV